MNDALIAVLAAYGPSTPPRLAALLHAREARILRQLDTLWREHAVDVEGELWRLSAIGQARARTLRADERRFEGLIRTRAPRNSREARDLTGLSPRLILDA